MCFIYVTPSAPPVFLKLGYHYLWSEAEEGTVSSICRSSESWFWTKQELQVSATKGSCILLSWAVGWHTLLLSLVWAVIQQPWHTGVIMFLRVQNQQELWASLYECSCSGQSSPADTLVTQLLLIWEPGSHLFLLLQALPETVYNFSCIELLQPTCFCSNGWEGVRRCGLWPIR